MKSLPFLMIALLGFSPPPAHAVTFNIENIHIHDQVSTIQEGIVEDDPASTSIPKTKSFIPQIEAEVEVSQEAQSKNLFARAYYFDGSGKLIQNYQQQSAAMRLSTDIIRPHNQASIWPTVLPGDQRVSIYFPLPANLPANWSLVVVFGNANGAVAASLPDDQTQTLNYPERDLVAKTILSPEVELTDKDQMAPLIEQVVQSDNPLYPAFTLLLHLPHGVTDPKQVSGVLATCIIANSVSQIRDRLNSIKPEKDPNPYFAYAESHKLAVVAWGARWVWSSYANFDELDENQTRSWDANFQKLADAWDRGIDLLANQYGIPDHDYLMYGFCAGGEWVHRLALHKPDRFLAVQMHISTSYDAPTPEASRILWLLTTGELDCGCDRARRFYSAAKDLNYPIIFKAVIGLGHADSPIADQLGLRFFDYALAMKKKRDALNANDLMKSQPLDLSGFKTSPFYGDLMNQVMFAAQDKAMIPPGFQVPLPTKEIANAWNK